VEIVEVLKNGKTNTTTQPFEIDLVYNGIGQRVIKVSPDATTFYLYDQFGNILTSVDSSSGESTNYVWLGNIPVAQIDEVMITFTEGKGKNSVTTTKSVSKVLQLHTDHLLTPRVATDNTGTMVWNWISDAFGSSKPNSDPDGDGTNTLVNLRFPGQYYDQESGLHYNYFRDYDPSLGRYIQSDPIGLGDGPNTYGYVHGNPLKYVDPTGEAAVLPLVAPLVLIPTVACAITGTCDELIDACGNLIDSYMNESSDGSSSNDANSSDSSTPEPLPPPPNDRDPKKDKKLSNGEIKRLKDNGIDPHSLKPKKNGSKFDLFKDRNGNIIVKPKNGSGPGDPTFFNINNF
jgi:RHS repeat-associated protein